MDLNKISAEVRPRSSWEAVDLGFHMVRLWWKPMLSSWLLITALPYFILNMVFSKQTGWICFGFWLCLPLWERVHLFIVSHALFGDVPDVKRSIKAFASYGFKQCLASISWRRLSPNRAFNLSVVQLENLKSATRQQRLQTLHYTADSTSFWLTIVCMTIAMIIYLTVPFLVYMFNPVESSINWGWGVLIDTVIAVIDKYNVVLLYLAVTLISPFYVAAGFALYLNRRTALEAWDLEIAFRRLVRRVAESSNVSAASQLQTPISTRKNSLLPVFALLMFSGFFQMDSYAQDKPARDIISAQQTQEAIKEILHSDEFIYEKTKEVWDLEWDDDSDESTSRSFSLAWLANSLEYILYGLFIGVIAFFIIRFLTDLDFSNGKDLTRKKQHMPETLFGLDMSKDKLPENIIRAVQLCWQSERYREALSLLYRAVLIQLMYQYECEFMDSYTEGECVTVVNALHKKELADYFYQLSKIWQLQAYAHRIPDDSEFQNLCVNWTSFFQTNVRKEE